MRRKRPTSHPPRTTPFGGIVLGPLVDERIAKDCFVWSDSEGRDWLVYGPLVVEQMRRGCPICEAGAEHA